MQITRERRLARAGTPRWPLIAAGLLLAGGLAACATQRSGHAELPVAGEVDLARYAGTWYEQARLPNRYQRDCAGEVRADYAVTGPGSLSVVNRCTTANGAIKMAEGEGRLARRSPPDPARLEVRFAPAWLSWLPAVWGDYWILRLAQDYRYSLVGTPDRRNLWVLSREQTADAAQVQALLDYAGTLGFPVDQVLRTAN